MDHILGQLHPTEHLMGMSICSKPDLIFLNHCRIIGRRPHPLCHETSNGLIGALTSLPIRNQDGHNASNSDPFLSFDCAGTE